MTLVEKISDIIESKKGEDIKIYDLSGKSPFYDYSIVCTGTSRRNVDAICEEIKKEIKDINGIEGQEESNWILIDAKDVIVNIFQTEAREYYELDDFYEKLLNG